MPSARELLEKADALMRKHRERDDTDIPVLVDAVEMAPIVDSPDVADIPVLTDIVEELVVDIAPLPMMSPLTQVSFEGDPSDWLVMDTVDPATHSITGGAPDTLGVVPPITLKAAGSAPTPPPARSTPAASVTSALDVPEAPFVWSEPERTAVPPASLAEAAASSPSPPLEAADAAHGAHATVAYAVHEDRGGRGSQNAAGVAAADDSDLQRAVPSLEWVDAEAPATVPTEESFTVAPLTPPGVESSHVLPAAAPDDVQSEPQGAPDSAQAAIDAQHASEREEERWQALAEQISMQVLQRVDLFTDAGLKDQLGERLQPLVARASAELVETVTEHVGQLLRTYVAEAIEREIAAWRRGQR